MKTEDLVNAAEKIQLALSDGKMTSNAGLIMFSNGLMLSYGDEISTSVPVAGLGKVKAAVHGTEFSQLIKKVKDKNITLKVVKDRLSVTSGKMKANFNMVDVNWEEIPEVGTGEGTWVSLPERFTDDLRFCVFSAATHQSFGSLTCLNVCSDRIISSDNFRITEKMLSSEIPIDNPVLIPRSAAAFLSRIKLVDFKVGKSEISYRDSGGVIFTHGIIGEEYPDVSPHLEIEGSEIKFPVNLRDALGHAEVVADEEMTKTISVNVSKGIFVVKGEGSHAEVEEEVDAPDYKDEGFSFIASPEHLLQILAITQDAIISDGSILFSGKGFRHLVALLGDEEAEE